MGRAGSLSETSLTKTPKQKLLLLRCGSGRRMEKRAWLLKRPCSCSRRAQSVQRWRTASPWILSKVRSNRWRLDARYRKHANRRRLLAITLERWCSHRAAEKNKALLLPRACPKAEELPRACPEAPHRPCHLRPALPTMSAAQTRLASNADICPHAHPNLSH